MIDQTKERNHKTFKIGFDGATFLSGPKGNWRLLDQRTFTRSNGTLLSRIYERLTKASRRAEGNDGWEEYTRIAQVNYRRGVYDAFKALQEELRFSD